MFVFTVTTITFIIVPDFYFVNCYRSIKFVSCCYDMHRYVITSIMPTKYDHPN